MTETLSIESALELLRQADAEADYRARQKLLKRAFYLMAHAAPPADAPTLERCIRGLTQAAKVHTFPGEIRALRTRFARQLAALGAPEPRVVASARGRLVFEAGAVAVFDPAFAGALEDPDRWPAAQAAGQCLFVTLGGDGACKGELRLLDRSLSLPVRELAKVTDSSEENVLLCPSGVLHFAGVGDSPRLSLAVPGGGAVAAVVHAVGPALVALIAPTDRRPPNDGALAAFEPA